MVSHSSLATPTGCCTAFCMAPILIVGSLTLLVLNERNALAMHRSLNEALHRTIALPNADQIDSSYDSEVVHVVGQAVTNSVLKDATFGVSPRSSSPVLKLRRNAEIFEWEESSHTETHTKKDGSEEKETVYEYTTVWSDHAIDSQHFYDSSHVNPPTMPYEPQVWTANPISIGAFTLPDVMVQQMDYYKSYDQPVDIGGIPDPNLRNYQATSWRGGTGFYLGNAPNYPHIGDERVWYDVVEQQTISFCAVQRGSTFSPFTASAGKHILLLEPGNHTVEELYENAHARAKNWAFTFRAIGFLLLWAGLFALMGPLTFLAEHVPILGPCLGQAVGLVAVAISAVLAILVCSTIIVCAWIAFRIAALEFLVWGIPLMLVVGGAIGLHYLRLQKQAQQPVVYFQENNNNLPSSKEVPYETIPEAKAEIWSEDPFNNPGQSVQPEYVALSVGPSAPPAYMDDKGEP